uniref:Uncharacterized protein n=1 Tax=Arundo donax TaxID=35708 RepID=A0A0A9AHM2_ARUDO
MGIGQDLLLLPGGAVASLENGEVGPLGGRGRGVGGRGGGR